MNFCFPGSASTLPSSTRSGRQSSYLLSAASNSFIHPDPENPSDPHPENPTDPDLQAEAALLVATRASTVIETLKLLDPGCTKLLGRCGCPLIMLDLMDLMDLMSSMISSHAGFALQDACRPDSCTEGAAEEAN